MLKINDDVLVIGGILGIVSLLSLLPSGCSSVQPKPKPKQKFINTYDALGPIYNNLRINGFFSTFELQQVAPLKEGTMGFTNGIYEKSVVPWHLQEHKSPGRPKAEIVMIIGDKPTDATEGEGIKAYQELDLHPNFDWRNMATGFYATINGLPTYMFRTLPSNAIFTKRVVEYGDKTEYTLISPEGTETFWNTSRASNLWIRGSAKMYTMGIEYHVKQPCLNNVCTHTPPPTFPVKITNYLPIGIKILNGVEHYKPIGPCTSPSCSFAKGSNSDCHGGPGSGIKCPSDPKFNCTDSLNRKISCATGLPLDSIIARPHTAFGSRTPDYSETSSSYGGILPNPIKRFTFS